ncbi:MAG: AfsR/SARP family transcriptional regulator [Dermatophilaceae bacterium]
MDRIRIFGATTVVVDGRTVSGPALGGAKPRQVLEVLALADGAPVSKDRLIELLWDGEPPASAVATLESYVCVARRAVRGTRGQPSVIHTTPAGYRLDTARISVDLSECRALLGCARTAAPEDRVRYVRVALALSTQPLLASANRAPWADHERHTFAQQLATTCARTARVALDADDVDGALEMSAHAITLDAFDESAVRVRMSGLAAAGRRSESVRCYLDLRHRLVADLGVEPCAATHDLYLRLLADSSDGHHTERPSPGELTGLFELLRDTLTRVPGIDAAPMERTLSRVASQALSLL